MSKAKPRHNPDKPQNKIGRWCSYYEGFNDHYWCELGYDITKCGGNPQKNNNIGITRSKY